MRNVTFQQLSDEELISRMRTCTPENSDYKLEKIKGTVRSLANRYYLIGADKDDLVQEGMIGLFKAIRDYRSDRGSSFYSFAVLCIKREMFTAVSKYQSKKNMPLNNSVSFSSELVQNKSVEEPAQLQDILQAESSQQPEQVVLDNEFENLFIKISEAYLSEKETSVLKLLIEGKGYREIAEELSMPPKSVDNAIQRCRQKLGKVWLADKQS